MSRKLWGALLALSSLVGVVGVTEVTGSAAGGTAPTVEIAHPSGSYLAGAPTSPPLAWYTCQDPDGDLVSCVGDVPHRAPVDLTVGAHTFTVTATDAAGHVTRSTSSYRVHPATPFCEATALRVGSSAYAVSGRPACRPVGPAVVGDVTTAAAPVLGPVLALLAPATSFPAVELEVEGLRAQAPPGWPTESHQSWSEVGRVRIRSALLSSAIQLSGARSRVDQEIDDIDPDQPCRATKLSGRSSVTFGQREDYTQLFYSPPPFLEIATPMTIPLGVGTLHLNQTIVTDQVVTQRALFLDLPGTANDVVVAESRSGYLCTP